MLVHISDHVPPQIFTELSASASPNLFAVRGLSAHDGAWPHLGQCWQRWGRSDRGRGNRGSCSSRRLSTLPTAGAPLSIHPRRYSSVSDESALCPCQRV